MAAYYNEIDPFAAAWLRELIAQGHIAPGDVDERSIEDVSPDDLRGYVQCHFFAGIGVWSYALRRAGWADDRPVWTGSCPCQPWSDAGSVWGRNKGAADKRDLWPAWRSLIRQLRPEDIFGEQVSGRSALAWVDRFYDDMGDSGYAVRAIIAEAAAFGAWQRRERFYFAAYPDGARGQGPLAGRSAGATGPGRWRGEEDLRAIADAPFVKGDRWPEPLLRGHDDDSASRVGRLRGYGNAIVAEAATAFIEAYCEAREETAFLS